MDLVRQLLAVGLVFALLALALWALRRRGLAGGWDPIRRSAGPRRLEVIERLALSPHHAVHLVRAADRVLLVAVFPGGCTLLDSLPPAGFEDRTRAMR